MSKQYIYEFTVEGSGQFAFDMLRYDQCWPRSESDSSHMDYRPMRGTASGPRTIQMRGMHDPTNGRWESFGWKVTESSRRQVL